MSNVRKKLVSSLVIIGLLIVMTTPVFARMPTTNEKPVSWPSINFNGIVPFWENTASAMANISIDGKTVKPSVAVKAKKTSATVSGTLYLEKSSDGEWVEVDSWSFSGTGSATLGKTYTGTSGVTYRSRAEIVVTYNGNSEEVECVSTSKTV